MDNNNNLNKSNFDWYIEELYKINSNDPKRASRIAKKGLADLGLLDSSNKTNGLGIDKEWGAVVAICILIALCVFLVPNTESIVGYIFGLVFFLAGLFIGLNVPIFGLIFLCSHGGIGLVVILSSLLGGFEDGKLLDIERIINNPAFSDGGMPYNLKLHLWAIVAVFVTAIVYTVLHNLSPRLKENKIHMIIILILYLVGIILVGLIPKMYPYLY